jgi:LuxR family transcriptional regulator, maltose regulon positive regulatory protein
MLKADPLIRTKLRLPFTRPSLVPRARLQARMVEGLRGPLTLVVAPAGFGKTTLVAACVAEGGRPVAWLSLDKDDNQAGRFLSYLISAVQAAAPAPFESEAAQLLAASPETPPETLLTVLVNDLDRAGPALTLVLDDYQLMSSPAVHAAVAFLLEHAPSTFHLVITTRSDPPLPLSRLRARAQTVELRAADLRFTEPEAMQFLNDVMGLSLDAQAVAAIEERTEGWVAGLQLAALSMRNRQDVGAFIAGFSGTNRHILDYLLEEVLAREPETVQAFLLQTASLTRLTGPLCDAVTGAAGGQAMLEQLERRNLFVVPLDDDRRWYRYHHLFADLLQARLHQSGPGQVARLLARAAEWCEREGHVADAVSYALAAPDYAKAAGLVEKYWAPTTSAGEIETVWSWLQALPEATVRHSAPLSAAYAWVLWLTGQVGAIEAHLDDAERALGEGRGADAVNDAVLPIFLAALRSIVARYQGEFETATTLAERALSILQGAPVEAPVEAPHAAPPLRSTGLAVREPGYAADAWLPERLPPPDNAQLRAIIWLALATASDGAGDLERAVSAYAETIRWSRLSGSAAGVTGVTYRLVGALRCLGRLRAADAAVSEALDYMRAQGMARLPAAGILHLALSELWVERNDLEAAHAHLAQSLELGKWSGRLDAARNTGYVLSRLRQAQQDTAGALAAVAEAEATLGQPAPALARSELRALRARVLVWQGNLAEAAQCADEAVRLAGRDRGQTGQTAALAAIRVRVAQSIAKSPLVDNSGLGPLRQAQRAVGIHEGGTRSGPGEAAALLTSALAAAEAAGRWGVALELRLLRSLALARQGDTQAAEADLGQALALARPEGYVRVFLDEGRPMQALLSQWLAQAGASPVRDYAAHLLSQFKAECPNAPTEPEKAPPVDGLIEPLSPRELEVLRLMALGKTNPQVARQLVVSPGTIKAHAASIYRKLDVANRTEAVARARQLGILA